MPDPGFLHTVQTQRVKELNEQADSRDAVDGMDKCVHFSEQGTGGLRETWVPKESRQRHDLTVGTASYRVIVIPKQVWPRLRKSLFAVQGPPDTAENWKPTVTFFFFFFLRTISHHLWNNLKKNKCCWGLKLFFSWLKRSNVRERSFGLAEDRAVLKSELLVWFVHSFPPNLTLKKKYIYIHIFKARC